MNVNAAYSKDNNSVTIITDGITISTSQTFTGNNTTVDIPLFHVVGSVQIQALYAVVTTDLGANHTAASWRLNDQTAQVYITAVGGTPLSAIKAGSVIVKKGVVATALTKLDNAAGVVSEPTTLETSYFSPFIAVKKTAATTDIEYQYTTTDTPTTGAMTFFARFYPLSADGTLTII